MSTFVFINEKAHEWQTPVWMAVLDYRKAFDTVEHDSLWSALKNQGVPDGYIRILSSLYIDQTGRTRMDKLSKSFDTMRGTKQGDP